MRKISILFFLSIILCCGCSDNLDVLSDVSQEVIADYQQAGDYYYYSNGEKHQLELNTEYVFVSSANEQLLKPLQLLRNYKMSDSKNDNVSAAVTRAGTLERQWSEIELQERISEI